MSLTQIITQMRDIFARVVDARRPERIPVRFPQGHPAAGVEAGSFMLHCHPAGAFEYKYCPAPKAYDACEAIAELVTSHRFGDLASLATWLSAHGGDAAVFIRGDIYKDQHIEALNEELPERGTVTVRLQRHPVWHRWFRWMGAGDAVDLSHVELADLLLDNQEDLLDPMLAKVLAQFRGARTVTYDADLDTGSAMGVRVEWRGAAGGDARTTETPVPREFSARIPAFIGAWSPGGEPRHLAHFRLRVIPPRKDGDAAPKFRIHWSNASDYELEAQRALQTAVLEALPDLPVYLGRADVTRYLMPGGLRQERVN